MDELLNCKELCKALKRGKDFALAMKRSGYVFRYKALGKTTLAHALAALERAPDFVAWDYLQPGWESMPKRLAEGGQR